MLNRFLSNLTATGHSGRTDRTADAPRTCDVTPLECKTSSWDGLLVNYRTIHISGAEFLAPSFLAGSVSPEAGNDISLHVQRFQTSDIDISYSIIGKKYVGFNPLIMALEEPDITIRFHSDI
jgi:hypothetical protein